MVYNNFFPKAGNPDIQITNEGFFNNKKKIDEKYKDFGKSVVDKFKSSYKNGPELSADLKRVCKFKLYGQAGLYVNANNTSGTLVGYAETNGDIVLFSVALKIDLTGPSMSVTDVTIKDQVQFNSNSNAATVKKCLQMFDQTDCVSVEVKKDKVVIKDKRIDKSKCSAVFDKCANIPGVVKTSDRSVEIANNGVKESADLSNLLDHNYDVYYRDTPRYISGDLLSESVKALSYAPQQTEFFNEGLFGDKIDPKYKKFGKQHLMQFSPVYYSIDDVVEDMIRICKFKLYGVPAVIPSTYGMYVIIGFAELDGDVISYCLDLLIVGAKNPKCTVKDLSIQRQIHFKENNDVNKVKQVLQMFDCTANIYITPKEDRVSIRDIRPDGKELKSIFYKCTSIPGVIQKNARTIEILNDVVTESLDLSEIGYDSYYIQESNVLRYVTNRIDNEAKLARTIVEVLTPYKDNPEAAELIRINEAKNLDSIKAKWSSVVAFAKRIFGKFMEAMSKIVLNQKGYLEKYKDIILKNRPKDIKISYDGDYIEGISRMSNTKIPIFDYNTHGENLAKEGLEPIVNQLFGSRPGFKYDASKDLAELFKDYFAAIDRGKVEKSLTGVNMQDLYDFCHDFDKIEKVLKEDQDNLSRSSMKIEQAMRKIINDAQAADNSQPSDNNSQSASQENKSANESFIYREADDDSQKSAQGSVKIDTSKVDDQVGSYDKADKKEVSDEEANKRAGNIAQDAKAGKMDNTTAQEIVTKWSKVCNTFISAKLTVCQRIASSYMEIIRTHVKSYVGTKENNK